MVATHLLVVTKYIILYIKGVRAIAPAENYPPVRVRVCVRVSVRIRVARQFSSGAIEEQKTKNDEKRF